MDTYEIIMTPDAIADLAELRDYIADVLRVPDVALNYILNIIYKKRDQLKMLGKMKTE